MYLKIRAFFRKVIFRAYLGLYWDRNLIFFWHWNSKTTAVVRAKKLTIAFVWPSTNKITDTQNHHKLILHSSYQVQRVLVVATKVEQATIRVGKKRLLVITGALIARTVTQGAMRCHQRWYLCLLHWIIQSSIHLRCPWLVNSHPDFHITQRQSRKLLQYLVGLHLIPQIPCHRRPIGVTKLLKVCWSGRTSDEI